MFREQSARSFRAFNKKTKINFIESIYILPKLQCNYSLVYTKKEEKNTQLPPQKIQKKAINVCSVEN